MLSNRKNGVHLPQHIVSTVSTLLTKPRNHRTLQFLHLSFLEVRRERVPNDIICCSLNTKSGKKYDLMKIDYSLSSNRIIDEDEVCDGRGQKTYWNSRQFV